MVKVVDSRVALKRIARKAIAQSRVKLAQRSVAHRTVAHSRVARPGTTLQETNISLAPWEEQNHLQSLWTLLRATKQKKEMPERACFFYASLFCHTSNSRQVRCVWFTVWHSFSNVSSRDAKEVFLSPMAHCFGSCRGKRTW